MRKINKIISIALIFMMIGVFLCQEFVYSSDTYSLRVPLLTQHDLGNRNSIKSPPEDFEEIYEYDFPLQILSDRVVGNATDRSDLIERLEGRNIYWENFEGDNRERLLERAGRLTGAVEFIKGVLSDYKLINISCFGGYLSKEVFHDIDLHVVVEGAAIETSLLRKEDYSIWPFDNVDKIHIVVEGEETLNRDKIRDDKKEQFMLSADRCMLYSRNLVLWGRDFALITEKDRSNKLTSAYGVLMVAYLRFSGKFKPEGLEIDNYKTIVSRLYSLNILLRFLNQKTEFETEEYESLFASLNGGQVPIKEMKRLYEQASLNFNICRGFLPQIDPEDFEQRHNSRKLKTEI